MGWGRLGFECEGRYGRLSCLGYGFPGGALGNFHFALPTCALRRSVWCMLPSRSGSFRLFRVAGIQVYLHWWWFVFAVIQVTLRSDAYSSQVWNVVEYLALFVIVLLHEFGHSLACRQTGGKADEIVLWPLGGVAFVQPPPRPSAELWSIAAGPLVNVLLIPVIAGFMWARVNLGWGIDYPDLGRFLRTVFFINIGLLVFNLLPVYPLDGGQILRSLLWFVIGRARSLLVASSIGLVGVVAIGGYFYWRNPDRWLIIGLLAVFLGQQCLAGFRQAQAMMALARRPRHAGFVCPTCREAPMGGPLWQCGQCGQGFDPFSTRGICPHCRSAKPAVPCPNCGSTHGLDQWETAAGFRRAAL